MTYFPYLSAAVPSANSTDNATLADVIGNKTDDETRSLAGSGWSLMGRLYVLENHFHGAAKAIPTGAAGTTLTAGTPAWTLGDAGVIAATNAIQSPYDVHFVLVENIGQNTTYELVLYAIAVEVGRIRFIKSATADPTVHMPIMTPLIAANSALNAKIMTASGNADTCRISVFYHTY